MNTEAPIRTAIGSIVEAGALAGAGMLAWHEGEVPRTVCVGWRDVEARMTATCHRRSGSPGGKVLHWKMCSQCQFPARGSRMPQDVNRAMMDA